MVQYWKLRKIALPSTGASSWQLKANGGEVGHLQTPQASPDRINPIVLILYDGLHGYLNCPAVLSLYHYFISTKSEIDILMAANAVPFTSRDNLFAILPPTPHQDESIAATVLTGKTLVPAIKGGPVLYRYTWPQECTKVIKEIFDDVCQQMLSVRRDH